jgi:hypothetical protein
MKHQQTSVAQRFKAYQPTKTGLFWACAGSVVLAVVVGFAWGGWVTGGSAREMAKDSAAQARQELVAAVCVDRFAAAPDAGVQLTTLNAITSSYARGKFIQEGGWAVLVPAGSGAEASMPARSSTDDRKAASLCASELAKLEIPKAESVTLAQ